MKTILILNKDQSKKPLHPPVDGGKGSKKYRVRDSNPCYRRERAAS